jgi:urea transporter
MEQLSVRWARLIASSRVLRFVDINLRGIGQVLFQNNPLTGALFLAAVGWGHTKPVYRKWRLPAWSQLSWQP